MPQINQLAEVAFSQFFWLLLVLALIYFGIGHFMLPKIQSTVEMRESRVTGDLAAAQSARERADAIEAEYRSRMDDSRAEALKLAQEAKVSSARANEQRMAAVNEEIGGRVESAEAQIRAAAQASLGEIEAVAAEAAREMVERLAGLTVSPERAASAVKAVIRG
jgi:F-type H+-transporting ATPase subunit b